LKCAVRAVHRAVHGSVLAPLSNSWGIDLWVLMSNERSAHLGGNKYHKLRGYVETAKQNQLTRLITMAGAHSNHLRAFAALCRREQLHGVAIIRGDELTDPKRHSAELRFAAEQRVELCFVTRAVYRKLREAFTDADRAALVPGVSWGGAVFVPEGGLSAAGVTGVSDWAREAHDFDEIYIACATGTTCAGFLNASRPGQKICGVAVLKNAVAVSGAIRTLARDFEDRFELLNDYVFAGFASVTPELEAMAAEFSEAWQLKIDTTYLARVVMAIRERALAGRVNGRVLLVYTYNE